MEAAFRKTLRRVTAKNMAFTYYKYKVEDLQAQSGARLRMNACEIMGIFLIPSEKELNFAKAIKLIDTAFEKVKQSGVKGERLAKWSRFFTVVVTTFANLCSRCA